MRRDSRFCCCWLLFYFTVIMWKYMNKLQLLFKTYTNGQQLELYVIKCEKPIKITLQFPLSLSLQLSVCVSQSLSFKWNFISRHPLKMCFVRAIIANNNLIHLVQLNRTHVSTSAGCVWVCVCVNYSIVSIYFGNE